MINSNNNTKNKYRGKAIVPNPSEDIENYNDMLKKYGNKNGWLFGQLGLSEENDPYIIGHVIQDADLVLLPELWAVEPNSVSQFTGEHDSEDHEIFEGDILEVAVDGDPLDPDKYLTQVWFEKGAFLVDVVGEEFDILDIGYAKELWSGCHKYCRVVGNISDNPELLKEQK